MHEGRKKEYAHARTDEHVCMYVCIFRGIKCNRAAIGLLVRKPIMIPM